METLLESDSEEQHRGGETQDEDGDLEETLSDVHGSASQELL